MAEKIKRTHAERDALLSKVFDSTLQTKDIEITEAGTMEITPDEGYFALKRVNLNVNVQGGSGGEGGGESEQIMYYGKNQTDGGVSGLVVYAELVKIENNILPVGTLLMKYNSMDVIAQQADAVAINMSKRIVYNGQDTTFAAILTGFPPSTITKEQFYAL